MAYNIFFPQVFNDIQDAVDWYNSQGQGLGIKFFTSVKRNYSLLKKDPFCIALKYDDIRCMPVPKFPYLIHYRIEKDSKLLLFLQFITHRGTQKFGKAVNKTSVFYFGTSTNYKTFTKYFSDKPCTFCKQFRQAFPFPPS